MSSPRTRTLIAVSPVFLVVGFLCGRRLEAPGTEDAPASRPRAEERAEIRPGPVPADPVREILARVDDEPAPDADGAIRGRIVTVDGRVLPGATVLAEPDIPYDSPREGAGPPRGDPLWREHEADLTYAIRTRRFTRKAVSGADGRFRISGLVDAPCRIRGHREGWSIRRLGHGTCRPGHEIVLVAEAVVPVEFAILGPDGRPVERALVEARGCGRYSQRNATWTPAASRIDLASGPTVLRAYAGPGKPLASAPLATTLVAGVTPGRVVLRLRERTGVKCTYRFAAGRAGMSMTLTLYALRIREGDTADPSRLASGHHHRVTPHVTSPRNGFARFCLADVPPGRYVLGVRLGNERDLATTIVDVTDGLAEAEVVATDLASRPPVTFRVLDPSGRRLAPGDYDVWRADLDGMRGRAVVRSRTFGTVSAEYDAAAGGEVEVRFEAPARLAVVVAGHAGSRYRERTLVVVSPAPGRSLGIGGVGRQPDARGRADFGPLAPGEWTVHLSIDTGPHSRERVHDETVTLGSGARELILTPPPLCEITLQADLDGSRYHLASKAEGRWRLGHPVASGTILFRAVAPGDHVLWRTGPKSTTRMPLRVDGDRVVRFEPE